MTKRTLWRVSVGERPYTVTVREEKKGANVVYDYTDEYQQRRKPSLGFSVRDGRGRIDREQTRRAEGAARDMSAKLRLARLRQETEPTKLTVEDGFARFHDEHRGGMPESAPARRNHVIARREWTRWLGPDTPWNRIARSDVEALAFRVKSDGKPAKADMLVRNLRTVHNWLSEKHGIDGLRSPTKGFPWKALRQGHTPRRKRYTPDEARRLLAVRDEIDPRFALFLALVDDSGARGKAVRSIWRSAIDADVEINPTPEEAPHGWLLIPGVKGQGGILHLLTSFERREIDRALTGYLRHLEDRYQDGGKDFPLFPGARIGDKADRVVEPHQRYAYKPVGESQPKVWLRRAERLARVEHVDGRGWHGLRRAWSDYLHGEEGLDVVTSAGGWASRDIPERIYLAKDRMKDLARAREAAERKRRER